MAYQGDKKRDPLRLEFRQQRPEAIGQEIVTVPFRPGADGANAMRQQIGYPFAGRRQFTRARRCQCDTRMQARRGPAEIQDKGIVAKTPDLHFLLIIDQGIGNAEPVHQLQQSRGIGDPAAIVEAALAHAHEAIEQGELRRFLTERIFH